MIAKKHKKEMSMTKILLDILGKDVDIEQWEDVENHFTRIKKI